MLVFRSTVVLAVLSHTIAFSPVALRKIANKGTELYSLPNALDTLTSGLSSICRLPKGVTAVDNAKSQEGIGLILYDIENDQRCRVVRERLTELNLNAFIVPAATNSKVFTDGTLSEGTEIPRLVADDQAYTGPEEIIEYLDSTFSTKMESTEEADAKSEVLDVLLTAGNYAASLLRTGRGVKVRNGAIGIAKPDEPLILYSYEGNQFCRLVREVLTELDLSYELKSAGKESPRRQELSEITGGSSQCPYLIDPNTNMQMSESKDIIAYLYKTYAKYTPPSDLLQFGSEKVMSLAKPIFAQVAPLQAGSNAEDPNEYQSKLEAAEVEVENEVSTASVVVYTYGLSPFSSECKGVLDNLGVEYKEISLGQEWIPGLITESGAAKRAYFLQKTGQSSLPHIFVNGKSIGGLFSGTPGLIPALDSGEFMELLN